MVAIFGQILMYLRLNSSDSEQYVYSMNDQNGLCDSVSWLVYYQTIGECRWV